MNGNYCTYDEAAIMLGISKQTLYQYVHHGKLKPIKVDGWRPFFDRSEILATRFGEIKTAACEVPVHNAAEMSKSDSPIDSSDTHMIRHEVIGVKREVF